MTDPLPWLSAPGAGKTLTGQAVVAVVAKRAAGEKPSEDDDCVIYRYGSFCTGIQVIGE
jgi:hypothetical protein